MTTLKSQLEARGLDVKEWQLIGADIGMLQVTITKPGPAEGATAYVQSDASLQQTLDIIDRKRFAFEHAAAVNAENKD